MQIAHSLIGVAAVLSCCAATREVPEEGFPVASSPSDSSASSSLRGAAHPQPDDERGLSVIQVQRTIAPARTFDTPSFFIRDEAGVGCLDWYIPDSKPYTYPCASTLGGVQEWAWTGGDQLASLYDDGTGVRWTCLTWRGNYEEYTQLRMEECIDVGDKVRQTWKKEGGQICKYIGFEEDYCLQVVGSAGASSSIQLWPRRDTPRQTFHTHTVSDAMKNAKDLFTIQAESPLADGKCLDWYWGDDFVYYFPCHNGGVQLWWWDEDRLVNNYKKNGLYYCLDLTGNGRVGLRPCDGVSLTQRWYTSGKAALVNKYDSQCLDFTGHVGPHGSRGNLLTWPCHQDTAGSGQSLKFFENRKTSGDGDDVLVRNRQNTLLMDYHVGTGRVFMYGESHGGTTQQFYWYGEDMIKVLYDSTKCLSYDAGNQNRAVMATCDEQDMAQKWYLTATHQLKNHGAGKALCLGVPASGSPPVGPGKDLKLEACQSVTATTASSQRFLVDKMATSSSVARPISAYLYSKCAYWNNRILAQTCSGANAQVIVRQSCGGDDDHYYRFKDRKYYWEEQNMRESKIDVPEDSAQASANDNKVCLKTELGLLKYVRDGADSCIDYDYESTLQRVHWQTCHSRRNQMWDVIHV